MTIVCVKCKWFEHSKDVNLGPMFGGVVVTEPRCNHSECVNHIYGYPLDCEEARKSPCGINGIYFEKKESE